MQSREWAVLLLSFSVIGLKQGHQKRGGRKRVTPNLFSSDYKRAILEAAYRIGEDGNGTNGIVGYFSWIIQYHPRIFASVLLNSLLQLEFAGRGTPMEPRHTAEEINQDLQDRVGLTGKNRAAGNLFRVSSQSPWAWTGQPSPVGSLMQVAVASPKAFCKLLAAAILRPPAAPSQCRRLLASSESSVSKPAYRMMLVDTGRVRAISKKVVKKSGTTISSKSQFLRTTLLETGSSTKTAAVPVYASGNR